MRTKDQLIVQKLKESINAELGGSAHDINLSSLSGNVELTGVVDVLQQKNIAEKAAYSVEGVKHVENNITICTDGTIHDKEIEAEVNKKFAKSPYGDHFAYISAKVQGGTAVVGGVVETQADRKAALEEASKALGVRNVVNNIHIGSTVDDASIVNEVSRLFQTSYIDLQDISINADDGKVFVTGYVTNEREASHLISIAEEVAGVNKVVNQLEIRPWNLWSDKDY